MTAVVSYRKWFLTALFNLIFVAIYGSLMRYKIAFDFPYLEQKNLLHAHSHFAFSGWISQFIYTGLVAILAPHISNVQRKKYDLLLFLNLIASYGMLIAFTIQGYKVISIIFSTATIIIVFFFSIFYIRDSSNSLKNHPSRKWTIAALLFNILSSFGPFSLAYMMATKNIDAEKYLASIYYYLHFQYNGWFFCGCMAVVSLYLQPYIKNLESYFWIFVATAIPTFFLSILWLKLPVWLYIITVLASILQLIAWFSLLIKLWKLKDKLFTTKHAIKIFFYAAVFALTIKFMLQTISVIPSLSQLVFGIRAIVIAYLHLVLLGVFSLFILGFLFNHNILKQNKTAIVSAHLFLIGVVLNEIFLAMQGFAAFAYISIPHINEILFVTALLLLVSIVFLVQSQFSSKC